MIPHGYHYIVPIPTWTNTYTMHGQCMAIKCQQLFMRPAWFTSTLIIIIVDVNVYGLYMNSAWLHGDYNYMHAWDQEFIRKSTQLHLKP